MVGGLTVWKSRSYAGAQGEEEILTSDNIMIYHYITGGRRNSYFIKYSDNIMINYAYMIKT